jgi:hypothetical protein
MVCWLLTYRITALQLRRALSTNRRTRSDVCGRCATFRCDLSETQKGTQESEIKVCAPLANHVYGTVVSCSFAGKSGLWGRGWFEPRPGLPERRKNGHRQRNKNSTMGKSGNYTTQRWERKKMGEGSDCVFSGGKRITILTAGNLNTRRFDQ